MEIGGESYTKPAALELRAVEPARQCLLGQLCGPLPHRRRDAAAWRDRWLDLKSTEDSDLFTIHGSNRRAKPIDMVKRPATSGL